jgi:hypothetical protein
MSCIDYAALLKTLCLDDSVGVTMNLADYGFEPSRNRRLYGIHCTRFEDLAAAITVASPRFVLFVAADVGLITGIDDTLRRLLDVGCEYLCAWGPQCEQLNDAMDHIVLMQELDGAAERTIMTTWHSNDSLDEAAQFALLWAVPDSAVARGCESVVLASVGNAEWGASLARVAESQGGRGLI